MGQKERIPQLDIFRAISIFAVMAIHATSRTLAETLNTPLFHLFLFINKFSQFAVPSFVFLSGFVLFYNYIDRPLTGKTLGKFYSRRLIYILVPYIVFSLLYFVLKLYAGNQWSMPPQEMAAKMAKYVLTGTAYTHLYYVIIIIQFYVLFPLLLWCLQKSRRLAAWAPLIGLALQWGFVVLNKYMVNHGYWQVPKGSLAITYFSYFLLGAAIAVFYSSLKPWLIPGDDKRPTGRWLLWAVLWVVWIAVGTAHVELWNRNYTQKTVINSFWFEGAANAHALLSCLVLLQLSFLLYGAGQRLWSRLLISAGACSFGIYLVHPAVLFFYRKIDFHGGYLAYALAIAGGWLAALLLSWIIVALAFRYIKPAWILFGSVPRRSVRQPQELRQEYSRSISK
ncbi:acyltransferase [Paenibacillus sp. URB8-2]|uniref:acyltransferase n=1 Tax=Paenibacillus sp. URB8-2 TaxID=2741301 RepID=UPI0015BE9CBE|nr:acyltransferase [Paenibacillus sp. URB8-2]BCG56703.1 acyltransferase 3 [Paenibacillus sp. URB8-2]